VKLTDSAPGLRKAGTATSFKLPKEVAVPVFCLSLPEEASLAAETRFWPCWCAGGAEQREDGCFAFPFGAG